MKTPIKELYQDVYPVLDEVYRLDCIQALLNWDQQVWMPQRSAPDRAEQIELINCLRHKRMTDPKFIELVNELNTELTSFETDDAVNLREVQRSITRSAKLSEDFVARKSRTVALAYSAWTQARAANDFKQMIPHLEELFTLAREEAERVGYEDKPYDALLDAFEPYATLKEVKPLLLGLADSLAKLIPDLTRKTANHAEVSGQYREDLQVQLCKKIAQDIGYRFEAGRLDKTHHPFMTNLGPNDLRITSRFEPTNYLSAIFTTLHEGGHALYEDGLEKTQKGRPCGQYVSLGIHESQSRLYENSIGRSKPFAVYLHRTLGEFFPDEQQRTSPQLIWESMNKVTPTLIRVEADEVTYSLHIVIRLLLEEALVHGELQIADLPGAWGDLYEKYLGIRPPNDQDGVLQDVHWFGGHIGYFSTYAIGNLFSAMMLEAIRKQIPDLDAKIEQGDFLPLLTWLRENIHHHGMRFRSLDLVRRATGVELSAEPFVRYLKDKFTT